MNSLLVEVYFFFLGCCLGSFTLTATERFLNNKNLIRRSHCNNCKKNIRWYALIPVLGFLLIRGRCTFCKKKIFFRYPISEFISGLFIYIAYLKLGVSGELFYMIIIWEIFYYITIIDWKTELIYSHPVVAIFVLHFSYLLYNFEQNIFLSSLIGMISGAGSFFFLSYFYEVIRKKRGIGEGDIVIIGLLGFVFGWQALIPIVFFASCAGIIFGIIFLLWKSKGLREHFPFAPALIGASFFHWYYPHIYYTIFTQLLYG